ncbi:transcription factor S-II, central domain-containing protein [Gongronella butleri]|nr:transcription factor S-II, central domain-containing protein [Gongronella butleri]
MGSRQARVVVERKKERRPKSQKEATMAISPLQQAKNTMRKKVTKSLTAILMNIMNTHGDDMPAEMQGQLAADPLDFAQSVAIRLENDLHARWTKGDDDSVYKSKIRSLMYNLKDKDNSLFQVRVARGDIPMDELAAMSAKDMANPTLRSMDDSLRQQSIKNITLKSAPGDDTIIKKTHKGDVVMSQPGPDITHQTSSQFSNHLPYAHLSRSRSPSGSPNSSQRDASPANLPVSRLATEIAQDDNETDHGAFTVDDNDTKKDKVVHSTFKKLMGSSQPPRIVAQPAHTHPTKDLEQMYGDSANDDVQLDIGDEGNLVERRSGEAAYIWHGRVEMPEVASFHAKAKQIGGPVLNKADWQALLSSQKMFIEGRIPTDKASAYLAGIQAKFASSHRLALLLIEPDTKQSASSERHAQGLLNHLLFKTRFGVVVRDKKKIKDFYLIPVDSLHPIPNFLHDPINSYSSSFLASNNTVDGFIGVLVLPTPPQHP